VVYFSHVHGHTRGYHSVGPGVNARDDRPFSCRATLTPASDGVVDVEQLETTPPCETDATVRDTLI
jgi:hypothetical protein